VILITVSNPLVTGGAWIGTLPDVDSYTHAVTATGGYSSASFTLKSSIATIEDWIEKGLARHIVVNDEAGQIVWEGFVNQVSVTQGYLRLTVGPLVDIANRVWSVYAPPDVTVNPPRAGARTVTAAVQDTVSQAKYGVIEKVLSSGTVETTVAEQIQDTYLAENAAPKTSQEIGDPSGPTVQIDCAGYYTWLDLVYYEDTDPYYLVPISTVGYGDINTSLVAWWKLEEAAGAQRNDSIGASHLTQHNAPAQIAGKVANCASFVSATSQYLDSAAAALDCGDIDFTIACWVWGDTVSSTPQSIVSKMTATATAWDGYNLGWAGGHVRWAVGSGANLKTLDGGVMAAAAWHFIVAKHNSVSDTIEIQIDNGAPVIMATGGTAPNDAASNFCVGAMFLSMGAVGRYLGGDVDEIGFWKRILSYDEITYLYNAGAGRTTPIVAYTTANGLLQCVLNASRAINSWSLNSDLSGLGENLVLTGSREDDDMRCSSLVQSMVVVGDATDRRWLFGIYADRKAKYWQAPNTLEYQARINDNGFDVATMAGVRVSPWAVLPGKWLFMTDFLPARSSSPDLHDDPRAMFIESVTYTSPNGLALSSGNVNTLPQMLSRMGLGGIG